MVNKINNLAILQKIFEYKISDIKIFYYSTQLINYFFPTTKIFSNYFIKIILLIKNLLQ